MEASTRGVAVVGAGYWGRNLVRNFHELGVLRAVCDTDPVTLDACHRQYPDVRHSSSLVQVLADPDVHGVVIATPPVEHGAMVREALLAGKDVFVEKPLCLSEREGEELARLAEDRSRILMVGHLLWYHEGFRRLRAMAAAGEFGRVQYIYSNRLNIGKLRREENVLWSFAPHDVSIILGLVGETPELVRANGGNFLHKRIADTTVSLLSFASGIQAHIFVSWLHPFKEQKLVVVGDRVMAVLDDTAPWPNKLQLYPHHVSWNGQVPTVNKAEVEYVTVDEMEPLRTECRTFLECMETRVPPPTDGREGVRVLRVLNACQQALETDSSVDIAAPGRARPYFVHETAVVDRGAEVGAGSKIWHFSHVLSGSRIGMRCNLGQNVVVGPNVTIGGGCKIQNNVSVYEGVTLEDDVFCGPSMVFTNVMNPRAHIVRKDEYRPTLVKRGATIGANATVICGNTLGRYSFVAAGAVVTKDVPDYALVAGNPARRVGWMCRCGERLGEDFQCLACGAEYGQTHSGLEEVRR